MFVFLLAQVFFFGKRKSVGLHAVHRKDYKDFSMDLNKISKRFEGGYGFTKHDFKMEKYYIKDWYRV